MGNAALGWSGRALSPSNHGAHNHETGESEAEVADHSRF